MKAKAARTLSKFDLIHIWGASGGSWLAGLPVSWDGDGLHGRRRQLGSHKNEGMAALEVKTPGPHLGAQSDDSAQAMVIRHCHSKMSESHHK